MRITTLLVAAAAIGLSPPLRGAPKLLDDQFSLPEGFHIYKVAERDLTGGSYDLVFDGQGRLLVGDGKNLRRLADSDGDQVYDQSEVIAEGLGGRGPQGLVVYGDLLYAVGGDGVQLFSGYHTGGTLKHERRLGAPFNTGGDHAAHTLLRGLDGYIYLVSGDGGGVSARKHITEKSSPNLIERNASVFRFDPTGEHWECIGSGGRNPPSLGMNYLGEFFSFDSDMEFHVDVPFYRPVRLNHWATGGDLGWQGVGAYPPYYLDSLGGVLDVGRGSPTSGVFYEHNQLPQTYRDAFVVCDYQWKSATTGGYANPGRLVSFHIERDAATWKAEMTVVAKPKPDAVDGDGKKINFAVVDADVAPDGSLVVSDHNQGVWRIFYDPSEEPSVPSLGSPGRLEIGQRADLTKLLSLPQPMAEWSRVLEERLIKSKENEIVDELHGAVLDPKRPLQERLRALRLLAPKFESLGPEFLERIARDAAPEIRGQAAWLVGIRKKDETLALQLLGDRDPFVLRRAAEAQMRLQNSAAVPTLVGLLAHHDRSVAYAAMTALLHHPTAILLENVTTDSQAILRTLVATHLRNERPVAEVVHALMVQVLDDSDFVNVDGNRAGVLDLLRVLGLFRGEVAQHKEVAQRVKVLLGHGLASKFAKVRWESARLLGDYDVAEGFAPMLELLLKEKDGVTQFHLVDSLAKISTGWTEEESLRLGRWLLTTQTGWFSEFNGKGLQFPGFWNTAVTKIASKHAGALVLLADGLKPGSELSKIAYKAIRGAPDADKILLKAFRSAQNEADRKRLIGLLREVRSPLVASQLLTDLDATSDVGERESLIAALGAQPVPADRAALFVNGLVEVNSLAAVERCASRILSDGKAFAEYGEAVKSLTIGNFKGVEAIAYRCIELMAQHPQLGTLLERALQTLVGHQRPSFRSPLQVIWSSDAQVADERAWFARHFEVSGPPKSGTLIITCDNEFEVFLNGKRVGAGGDWENPKSIEVGRALKSGKNLIAVEGVNLGGPAGLAAILRWTTEQGSSMLSTDTTWKLSSARPPKGWQSTGAAAGSWGAPRDVSVPTNNVTQVMAAHLEKTPMTTSEEVQEYWQVWFRKQFGQPYLARVVLSNSEAWTDENLHALLLGMKEFKGDAAKGRQVYLKATCFACHGGLAEIKGSIFGPPLAGVTQRLNRQELADAIVYPSKLVSERFKASVLITADGRSLNGFITENSDEFVSITDVQGEVTRLPRGQVKEVKSQDESLMPAKLLSALKKEEIIDLMAFIHGLK